MTRRLWTVVNAVMLLMFVFSAAIQFNDPDPLAWMCIYGAAAIVCGLAMRRKAPAWLPVCVAVTAFAWAASLLDDARGVPLTALFAQWEMRDLRIEEAREMYGLAIVGIWMLVIAGVQWTRARITRTPSR